MCAGGMKKNVYGKTKGALLDGSPFQWPDGQGILWFHAPSEACETEQTRAKQKDRTGFRDRKSQRRHGRVNGPSTVFGFLKLYRSDILTIRIILAGEVAIQKASDTVVNRHDIRITIPCGNTPQAPVFDLNIKFPESVRLDSPRLKINIIKRLGTNNTSNCEAGYAG